MSAESAAICQSAFTCANCMPQGRKRSTACRKWSTEVATEPRRRSEAADCKYGARYGEHLTTTAGARLGWEARLAMGPAADGVHYGAHPYRGALRSMVLPRHWLRSTSSARTCFALALLFVFAQLASCGVFNGVARAATTLNNSLALNGTSA